MSFSTNGVTLSKTKKIRNRIFRIFFKGTEGLLSILFVISLAAPMVFPRDVYAVAGVPARLSYQGRLTDNNGTPLSSTYCIRYSIYDAQSAGTKLWPTGTPTATSTLVSNGVFNAPIGEMDSLSSYDPSANDTEYLNVDVYNVAGASCTGGAWEPLTPRQKIDATLYAQVTAFVWGPFLKTDITNSRVQVGAGTGTGAPIWLNLDWKNTPTTLGANCSTVSATNGAVWYNSSGTRALACINNVIVGVDNASEIASLNIGGNTAGTPATITSGAVTLAGGTNITLSQAGNVITVVGPYVHNVTLGGNSTSAGAGYIQISSGTMLLAGGNNITLSQNGNSVTISGQPAHGVVIASGVGGGTAGVTASISSGYMTLVGGNNITLSQNGNAITISAGAGGGGGVAIAGGASTATNGTVIFSNANGVTFGLNAGTMTASVGAGGAGATISRFMWPQYGGLSVITTAAQGTMSIQYMPLQANLSASRMDVVMSFAPASSAAANTAGVAITQRVGIFSRNGLTLNSIATASNQQTISWASNTGSYSSIAGPRYMSVPLNVNIGPGDYYVAYALSTAQSSIGTATTALAPGLSIMGVGGFSLFGTAGVHASNWGITATSNNVYSGMGVYSAQVATNFGNLSLSAIGQTGINVSKANFWFQFRNL